MSKNKWKKKGKPFETASLELRKLYESKHIKSWDVKRAKELIDWRIINFSWSDKQFERVLEIIKDSKKKPYSLYAITDGKLVKLGFSMNFDDRIKKLQTGSYRTLGRIWGMDVGYDRKKAYRKEKQLHEKCKKFRVRGEWFSLGCMRIVMEFRC